MMVYVLPVGVLVVIALCAIGLCDRQRSIVAHRHYERPIGVRSAPLHLQQAALAAATHQSTAVEARPASRGNPHPACSLRHVRKVYPDGEGGVVALDDVNMDIGAGFTGIVGPSGEGKSTLLNLIGGLDTPTSGDVFVFGKPLAYEDSAAMRAHRATTVAPVFQEMNLISHQTAQENAALGLLCRGESRRKAMAAAMQNLELLDIAHLAKRYPSQLSRGQQQRVAIARALTSNAPIILADEPTGSLDPDTAEVVMREFRKLSKRTGKPVVLVTHNHTLAHRYCDQVLECGRNGLRDVTGQHEHSQVGGQGQPAAGFAGLQGQADRDGSTIRV
jgi:ABC-type lipoprotein export system ATPase subunit